MNELEGLTVLGRMTQAMGRASHLDEYYDETLRAIEHATGSRRASISLFDPDGVLRFKAWRGISASYRAAFDGYCPWTLGEMNAMPLLVVAIAREPGLVEHRAALEEEGIAAMAIVPLVSAGRGA